MSEETHEEPEKIRETGGIWGGVTKELTFTKFLGIVVAVVVPLAMWAHTKDEDLNLIKYQMTEMRAHQDRSDATQQGQAATLNQLVIGQAEGKMRGESILALLQQQKTAQDEFRADLQRVTGRLTR